MSGPDNLSDLLVPDLIGRFDAIPPDTVLSLDLTKGELAFVIKSQYQLHQGLAALIQSVNAITFSDDARTALSNAYQLLQASQQTFSLAANTLLEKTVAHWEGR